MSDFKNYTDKFFTEVANVANYIGTQTGKVVDKTKLKISISNQEAIVDKLYRKIGRYYYERYRQGEDIDDNMIDNCKMIHMYQKSIHAMKEDLNK